MEERQRTWEGRSEKKRAKALEEGYKAERGQPYLVTISKVLKGQGPAGAYGRDGFRGWRCHDRRIRPGRDARLSIG